MRGRGSHHSVPIFQFGSFAVLFLLLYGPPVAAAIEFGTPNYYTAGISPVVVAVGDFNRDGKLDLAVANHGGGATDNPGSVSILLGNGDGTFQAAVDYPAGQYPNSIAVGDFNGDGKLDLAVANQGNVTAAMDGSVSILLGNGDGSFQAAVDYAAGKIPSSIAVGDFNSDGKLDLVVANVAGSENSISFNGSLSILLGIGDGTFQPAVDYQPLPSPKFVLIADLNHDGKLDLITLDQYSAGSQGGTSGVLLGNGDGTFQTPLYFNTGSPAPIVLGDFNNDGNLDLAQAHGNVYLYLGNGDGTFQPPVDVLTFPLSPGLTNYAELGVAADINGDGRLDLVGWFWRCDTRYRPPRCRERYFVGMLGRGDGTFLDAGLISPSTSSMVAAANLNGDNLPDLVSPDPIPDNVGILLNASPTSGADLALGMSGSPSTVAVGQSLTFTIQVTNEGPQDATGMTVTDMLPPELTLVSATPSQGTCQGTSSISCDLGSLSSPSSAIVTVTATVNSAGTNDTITNQASVSATESDLNTANNSASIITNVQDFQLAVSTSSLTVPAGGSVTDTVSLSPLGGFNQTATLTCTGAPSNATCQVSPASLTLDGSNMASAILTVHAATNSSSLPLAGMRPFGLGKHLPIYWAVILLLLMLFGRFTRDPWRRNAARGLTFTAMALLVVMWAACSGRNNVSGPEVSTLTVTATAGSFTQSVPVTLTIK